MDELKKDTQFLRDHNINDYSLLVGVHSRFEEEPRLESDGLNPNFNRADSERRKEGEINDDLQSSFAGRQNSLSASTKTELPPYVDFSDGGIESENKSEVYFMGIIDILTEFNMKKKMEFVAKSLYTCSQKFSCIPPEKYQRRFLKSMSSVMTEDSIRMRKE